MCLLFWDKSLCTNIDIPYDDRRDNLTTTQEFSFRVSHPSETCSQPHNKS